MDESFVHISCARINKDAIRVHYSQSESLNKRICLIVLPSLTCSFAANHHLNFPRRSWVRTSPGSEIFFSFSVWAHFLSRANAQRVIFGMFTREIQLITFKPMHYLTNVCNTHQRSSKFVPCSKLMRALES